MRAQNCQEVTLSIVSKLQGRLVRNLLVLKSLYLTGNCKERKFGKFVIKLIFLERNLKFNNSESLVAGHMMSGR